MGSTGEHDRKRRHITSISSPTSAAAAAAKKQPFAPLSEDKKLDITVLQYQNQKLQQKLETQKVEYSALENELAQLKKKQLPYDPTLAVVNKSWRELVKDLESCSIRTRKSTCQEDAQDNFSVRDGAPSTLQDTFLNRLAQAGATESSCMSQICNKMEKDRGTTLENTQSILGNIVAAIDNVWNVKDALHDSLLKELPEDGLSRRRTFNDLRLKVKNLRLAFCDSLLKHRGLARDLQNRWDIEAKNKAEIKRLKGELEITLGELEQNNRQLATLKAEKDSVKGTTFPVLNCLNKPPVDRARDKQKDLQDMESTLKELTEQASSRMMEIKSLHEERIKILHQLSSLQNTMKNAKCISSSKAYLLVKDQLEKSKSEVFECQTMIEKLQVEKDNLVWRERELIVKNDVVDVLWRSAAVVDSRITDLGIEIQKQIEERKRMEAKLEEASREPGRKEVLEEFKALVSSFPEQMGAMQGQLRKYKDAASDFHSLQADVLSLSSILDRKVKECETFSTRSSDQFAEIQQLKTVVQDLKDTESELKLFLEMYRHELTDQSDVMEARDLECKAWAHVESLRSALDERNLELRVKKANEAEATSQQRLAAVEAEIADLRQRLEASKRNKARLSDLLKSKTEENEAYLAEIETIGQAYDDMQTQNQHLLQQITERDDYNIKLVLEGVRARQTLNTVLMEKRKMEREIQQGNASLNFYEMRAARIEDQLKICSDQLQRLAEHKFQGAAQLENAQSRLMDVKRSSDQARDSLEEAQSKVVKGRLTMSEMQIDLEKERLKKKRIEEDLEALKRKAGRLQAQTEDLSIVEKLQQELGEYREILKCDICLDRTKQVVITKCYHMFCKSCVQKVVASRQRKCPKCSISFGPNDIKSVYI